MTDTEHNIALLALVTYIVVVGVGMFYWNRYMKYRDYYRRRNHPSMRNK